MTNIVTGTTDSNKVEALRRSFEEILSASSNTTKDVDSALSVMDLGGTKETILNAIRNYQALKETTDRPSVFTRAIQKVPGLNKLVAETKERIQDARFEGKSISEVGEIIIGDFEDRRSFIIKCVEDLMKIRNKMKGDHSGYQAILDDIDITLQNASDIEGLHLNALKMEVLQTQSDTKKSIDTVAGTVNTAQIIINQVSTQLPRLRNSLVDNLHVTGTLEKLNEMAETFDETLQFVEQVDEENIKVVRSSLEQAVDRQIISEDSLKKLENRTRENAEFTKRLNKATAKVAERTEEVIHRLETVVKEQDTGIYLTAMSTDDESTENTAKH